MLALFNFTIRQTLFRKKMWFTLLLLALPIGLTLMIRSLSPPASGQKLWEHYHIQVNSLVFSMILPLMCMLHGIAMIGAEAEGGTLAYLLTRTLRRSTVLLAKFCAMATVLTSLVCVALVAQYAAAFYGIDVAALGSPHGTAWQPFDELLTYLSVAPFAVTAYLSLFVLISLISARPLMASILFTVVIEMFLSNLPIGVRVYSVAHQIRTAVLERIPELITLFEKVNGPQPEPYATSYGGITALGGAAVAALALGCVLMSTRELIAPKIDSD